VVARNARSHTATQWRPLIIGRHLERPEAGRTGARVVAQLGGGGADRLLGEHAAEWPAATGAHGLPGRTDAGPAPVSKRVLDDTVLACVVSDHGQAAAGPGRGAECRDGALEMLPARIAPAR